jgi:hypothetical protein
VIQASTGSGRTKAGMAIQLCQRPDQLSICIGLGDRRQERRRQRHRAIDNRRPDESALLKTLGDQPHPTAVHACRGRGKRAPGQRHGRRAGRREFPSDSRHLIGLGQALLRRGKQVSGRRHGEPRATRLLMKSPSAQTAALLWCRCSGHGAWIFGPFCKRPFACTLSNCIRGPRATPITPTSSAG